MRNGRPGARMFYVYGLASRLLLEPGGWDNASQSATRRTEMNTNEAAFGVVDLGTGSGGG
jgi:hypothetical protein